MTLVAVAHHVSFQRPTGGFVAAARGSAWLYDASGSSWGRCSILVMPFSKSGGEPDRVTKTAVDWFGRDYEVSQGNVNLPPRALADWAEVTPCARIWYTRSAGRPGKWDHPFGAMAGGVLKTLTGSDLLTFKDEWPTLYKRGNAYRLELGKGCVITGPGGIKYP